MPKTQTLDKFAISAALQEISSLLELKSGVSRFKAHAYQTGARAIAAVAGDIGRLIQDNRLTSIPGIGNALASQIKQLHSTGSCSVLEGLRKEFPPGIIELSGLPGLSIAKIAKLHEELGVTSIVELQAAAEAGRVRNVKGFGAKTQQRLLELIADHDRDHKAEKRFPYSPRAANWRPGPELPEGSTWSRGGKLLRVLATLERNCRHDSHRGQLKPAGSPSRVFSAVPTDCESRSSN